MQSLQVSGRRLKNYGGTVHDRSKALLQAPTPGCDSSYTASFLYGSSIIFEDRFAIPRRADVAI